MRKRKFEKRTGKKYHQKCEKEPKRNKEISTADNQTKSMRIDEQNKRMVTWKEFLWRMNLCAFIFHFLFLVDEVEGGVRSFRPHFLFFFSIILSLLLKKKKKKKK